jgi:hypothetical protein
MSSRLAACWAASVNVVNEIYSLEWPPTGAAYNVLAP